MRLAQDFEISPHEYDFVAGVMAGHDLDTSYRDAEMLCDESAHRLIRLFVNGWSGDPHEQTPSTFTADLVPFGARYHPHRQPQRFL